MQTYCERCGPGLFDEPINAASNVAFLLAAWGAWHFARGRHPSALAAGVWVLVAFAISVGVGSALWHTFATEWAMYLDIIPIICFQCAFLLLYARHKSGSWRVTGGAAAGLVPYVALGFWLGQFPWLNWGLVYVPVLLVTWALAVHHHQTAARDRYVLLVAAAAFCVSLVCRTIDLIVCRQFPIGTHFLWHVFNGLVVYLSMRAMAEIIAEGRGAEGPPAPVRSITEPVK